MCTTAGFALAASAMGNKRAANEPLIAGSLCPFDSLCSSLRCTNCGGHGRLLLCPSALRLLLRSTGCRDRGDLLLLGPRLLLRLRFLSSAEPPHSERSRPRSNDSQHDQQASQRPSKLAQALNSGSESWERRRAVASARCRPGGPKTPSLWPCPLLGLHLPASAPTLGRR